MKKSLKSLPKALQPCIDLISLTLLMPCFLLFDSSYDRNVFDSIVRGASKIADELSEASSVAH
jgi:hypothetical protein